MKTNPPYAEKVENLLGSESASVRTTHAPMLRASARSTGVLEGEPILPTTGGLSDMATRKPLDVERELIEVFKQNGLVERVSRQGPTEEPLADEPSEWSRTLDCCHRRSHAKCAPHVCTDGWCTTWSAGAGSQWLNAPAGTERATPIHGRSRTPFRDRPLRLARPE
jgi:hypothetical protein